MFSLLLKELIFYFYLSGFNANEIKIYFSSGLIQNDIFGTDKRHTGLLNMSRTTQHDKTIFVVELQSRV